jgi:uncharacterized LabA/DUF88 family protein
MSAPNSNRIALFIDGANLHATARTLGFDIDYKRLLTEFSSHGTVLRAFYYTTIIEDQEYSPIRPLIDWLDYNGYTVVTKATKEFVDAGGRRKLKGNMDIEIAVDAIELARHVDQIVLFTGDGDFRPLVEAVQRRGVRVTIVSTISSQPPLIADELRRQADVFIDIADALEDRPQSLRASGPARWERASAAPPDFIICIYITTGLNCPDHTNHEAFAKRSAIKTGLWIIKSPAEACYRPGRVALSGRETQRSGDRTQ